ncbi:CAP domain-containing protein [Bacillaceae bacterium Marseille-Q3522]|nr:CAP domain-containing protein [Bacillaceae bacterium Marseille-Q3522]
MKGGRSLKTLIRVLVIISLLLCFALYLNLNNNQKNDILIQDENSPEQTTDSLGQEAKDQQQNSSRPQEGIMQLIGKTKAEIEKQFGPPDRVDRTAYGYDWMIYNKDLEQYMQIGVENEKVVTIFSIGANVNTSPFKIGQSVSDIYSANQIDTTIGLEYDSSTYRFELSEEDINSRPLIQFGDIYAQLYIDKFTGTLSSIRIMDGPTLLKLRPYEMVYRGELLELDPPDKETEAAIENGKELQIFDLTNILRKRFELEPLKWDDKTAEVAYLHSKDMFESEEFSHTSEKYGELSDRLDAAQVYYEVAGENIAANYVDAPAVVEGWLNSEGHRKTILNEEFSHIGVGVFQKHYTQNFIKKWEE